jgi:tRNA U34 5-methylaminomethyl-2-thiouridine-forming methyltransferase MnmC
MGLEIILSGDGSHTLYNPELNETYHSKNGAIQESNLVFIQNGLEHYLEKYPDSEPRVLEIGFGTGLNTLLTANKAKELKVKLHYSTLETFVLPPETTQKLNYAQSDEEKDIFEKIHQAEWGKELEISPFFTLTKHHTSLQDFDGKGFDLIFFDAFAPDIQPELWSLEVFEKLAKLSNSNCVWVSYCAKGQVRRNLKEVGFSVERLQGPPGKREMLRGSFIN